MLTLGRSVVDAPGPDGVIFASAQVMRQRPTSKTIDATPADKTSETSSPTRQTQRNVRAIARLEREALHDRTAADRVSAALTHATGSAPFVVMHAVGFTAWIVVNLGLVRRIQPFDPYPFNFLTLVVSLEAIFLSVFVLMSQNHMTRQADKSAHLDLQVDLLAERELTIILHMVRGLCEKQGVCMDDYAAEVSELLEETDVHALASALDERLPAT